MEFSGGNLYHVYNQGNNRIRIFYDRANYLYFLKKMRLYLLNHSELIAWCLMPNHFHWLIRVNDNYNDIISSAGNSCTKIVKPLNRNISTLLSSYTRGMNKTYGKTGSLFRGKTKAKLITGNDKFDDDYALTCFLYIHLNPFNAGLGSQLEDWEFSSFRDYIGARNGTLCNTSLGRELLALPEDAEEFSRLLLDRR